MAEVMTAQKVAARTEDAVKVYGKGQTEVRALDGVTVEFAADEPTGNLDSRAQQQLVSNLKRALPPGTEALTGAAAIKEQQDQFQKALSIFGKFFLIFAVVALVVGAYIILNTFAITVAQRTRENGLLRALGASRRQVLASVLIEALVVGVIAALLGLTAGVAVAAGLKALLSAFGLSLPGGSLVLNARTVVASLVIGIGVTLIAAISPARKAAKVPPVAAMQEATVGSTGYGSKQRLVVGLCILALGVAALFTGLFGHVSSAFLIVGVGVLLVFLGVSVLGRTIALPLSRAIGAPLPRVKGVTGTLARENTMRNPKRRYAPGTTVQDQAAYKAEQTKPIDQILALIYTLLALAIVIALLGIGNTLALSIFERTRELGVMRAVGMTRRQLRSTIRWESVIIALQGTFLGLLVGVFFGCALVQAQKNQGLSVFSVPYLTLILIIVLAGLAGVVAAILPSRRAAKLNVLRAIVTE
jgi:ABC-type antimicrobial peptide transport system permease subunit